MTEHVDELVKELRRRNHEKKRAAYYGKDNGKEQHGKVHNAKARKKEAQVDEEVAARLLTIREYKDLHEVALRVRGKK